MIVSERVRSWFDAHDDEDDVDEPVFVQPLRPVQFFGFALAVVVLLLVGFLVGQDWRADRLAQQHDWQTCELLAAPGYVDDCVAALQAGAR